MLEKGWQRWFAWHPVKCHSIYPARIVWLGYVLRTKLTNGEWLYYRSIRWDSQRSPQRYS